MNFNGVSRKNNLKFQKHRPLELVREGPPTQRKRKRKEKQDDPTKFMQGYVVETENLIV